MTLIGRTQSPPRAGRWLRPTMGDVVTTSAAFGTAGRAFVAQVQVPAPVLVDAVSYVVGATASGNVIVSLLRAVSLTADTPVGGTVVAESASTAQGGANDYQMVAFAGPALLAPGYAYYVALQGSSATGTYMRLNNQRQAPALAGYFDVAAGFGPVTIPASWTDTGSGIPGLLLRVQG